MEEPGADIPDARCKNPPPSKFLEPEPKNNDVSPKMEISSQNPKSQNNQNQKGGSNLGVLESMKDFAEANAF